METIPQDISEEEFLERAMELIGPIKKTEKKTLTQETFVKIFKYSGDFAKLKNRELKAKAQEKRCEHFGKDPKDYMNSLKENITGEEKAYEAAC